MPSGRPSRQTQRAVAIFEQASLNQFNAQPSRLTKLMEQSGKPTPLQRKIALETVTRAGSIEASNLLHGCASGHIAHVHLTSQQNVFQALRQLNAVMTMPMDEITTADMVAWTTG